MCSGSRRADAQPLDPRAWRIEPPAAGSRHALVVTFPKPLDHGLLMRALGVARDGESIAGDITVEAPRRDGSSRRATPGEPGR